MTKEVQGTDNMAKAEDYKERNSGEYKEIEDHFNIVSELCRHFYAIVNKRPSAIGPAHSEKLRWLSSRLVSWLFIRSK